MTTTTQALNISFLSAERTTAHEVKASYTLNGIEFAALWNCIHGETGEVTDYDLSDAEAQDSDLKHRVLTAIQEGENGQDGELYLFIKDTFDSSDAESTSYDAEINSVIAYEMGNGYEAEVTIKGENFKVYLQLPSTGDSQHSTLMGELHSVALNEIAEKAENKFESFLDMFVVGNITAGAYEEKKVSIDGYGHYYLIGHTNTAGKWTVSVVAKDEGVSSYYNKAIYGEIDLDRIDEELQEKLREEISAFNCTGDQDEAMKYAIYISYKQSAATSENYILSEHDSLSDAINDAVEHLETKEFANDAAHELQEREIERSLQKFNSYETCDYTLYIISAKDAADEPDVNLETGCFGVMNPRASNTQLRRAVYANEDKA